jgi:hypothetical protein
MMNQKSTFSGNQSLNLEEPSTTNLLDRRKFIEGITTAALAMTVIPETT